MEANPASLWRDLRGRTNYRVLAALILSELAQQSGLSTAEVLRRLRSELRRTLSRQTFAAWLRGDQAMPAEVIVAVAAIARVSIGTAAVTVAMRVMEDPAADQRFASALRRYYSAGRLEFPPRLSNRR
jgi:hypothetical protein